MIVVADASPLNYLIQIQCDHLLYALYRRIFVPPTVLQELRHSRAPSAVIAWLREIPNWLEMRAASGPPDASLEILDPGEREAILLAQEIHADLLLIDEREGRREAKRRRILTTGTLGVLLAAGAQGLIDPEMYFQRLMAETSFRATPGVHELFLAQYNKLREKKS
jgi:predicted nucleic acid-binding protein